MPPMPHMQPMPTIWIVTVTLCAVLAACFVAGGALDLAQHLRAGPADTPVAIATTAPFDGSSGSGALFAPTVGGTTTDFLQTYPVVSDSRGLMYTTTIAGQRVLIVLTLADGSQTFDGQPHVAIVNVRVPDDALGTETWSDTTAAAIAQTFLPPDATGEHTVTTNGLRDHLYHSDALEATFPADQFTNEFGDRRVAPGTVSYTCQPYPHLATGYGQCVITIGSH